LILKEIFPLMKIKAGRRRPLEVINRVRVVAPDGINGLRVILARQTVLEIIGVIETSSAADDGDEMQALMRHDRTTSEKCALHQFPHHRLQRPALLWQQVANRVFSFKPSNLPMSA
jgi:hypothetical protein